MSKLSSYYAKALVTECDCMSIEYDKPVMGAYVIAPGATGRWCCVMFVGPEFLKSENITPTDINQLREEVNNLGNGAYADF